MNYIEKIFERADISQIVNFILYGMECHKPKKELYKEAIEKTSGDFLEFVSLHCSDKKSQIKIEEKYLLSISHLEDIFTEIGIKCAFKILNQLNNYNGNT